ncbi:MAG: hypothetical protein CfP315_0744 [Candidatus Improbicoccus pseudotrichonymphae]|uniref:Uncharacterized protein n=1 Tax=Candidatus Improbicoccus pseudotrichonymphae TaxID=3033792 RepID=A0AA48HYN2_9FIRM|nr:MAG: hypothetical protein CfP315_0744 [Candidatus Improbicoccus pseudotrichonymphae]
MNLEEKAAYVKGLVDGLELEPDKKETKVINAMSSFIECCTEYVLGLRENLEESRNRICDLEKVIEMLDESFREDPEGGDCCCSDNCCKDNKCHYCEDDIHDLKEHEHGCEDEIAHPNCDDGSIYINDGS